MDATGLAGGALARLGEGTVMAMKARGAPKARGGF